MWLVLFGLLVAKAQGHALQQFLLPAADSDGMKAKLSGDQVVGLESFDSSQGFWLWIQEFPSLDPDPVEIDFLSLTLPIRKQSGNRGYHTSMTAVTDLGVYLILERE